MAVTATLSNYRQTPRKVRLVATLLKGKPVSDALLEVKLLDKRAAAPIEKLIRSAVANAKAQGLSVDDLFVTELRVDKGVVMKRIMPRAMGRAFPILKRSSHITVVLGEKEKNTKGSPKAEEKNEKGVTSRVRTMGKNTPSKTKKKTTDK